MSIASSRPPDQGRVPYLQQLAQRSDRRLLLGSVVLAAIGLVLAVRGTSVPAASAVAAAVLPAAWLGWRQAGHALARNGLAVVLSLQLSLLCHISGLNAALPIALLLGVLLIQRDRMPLWLAGAIGVIAVLAPLLEGAAVLPPLLNATALAVLTLVLGQTAARLRQQSEALGHGPHRLAALARDIATGADLGAHSDARNYAPGSLAHALADTARHVQAQRGREAEAHAENAQIRQALDASRTAMMIADNDHVIRYVNRSVVALLRNQQATLRQAFPDFDAERLVGSSIHRFHANPDRIRGILNGLQVTHHGKVRIGPVHFAQVVTPVFDAQGARLGFAVEWHDRTHELTLENAVAGIVDAAAQGDLEQRLQASEGASFLDGLTGGINQLLDTLGSTVDEVRQMLSAMANGDLDRRMQGEYHGAFAAIQRCGAVDAVGSGMGGAGLGEGHLGANCVQGGGKVQAQRVAGVAAVHRTPTTGAGIDGKGHAFLWGRQRRADIGAGAGTGIEQAALGQRFQPRGIGGDLVGLAVDRAIPCQTQPCQILDNLRLPLRAAPLKIGILHPEQELPTRRPRAVMGEDGGIGMAQMQRPGWRRREPGAERGLRAHWPASHPAKLSLARSV